VRRAQRARWRAQMAELRDLVEAATGGTEPLRAARPSIEPREASAKTEVRA
jgi:hypothetical protein